MSEELESIKQSLNKIKDKIKTQKGDDLHDWEYISVHHGWTWWHKCRLCGKYSGENKDLSKEQRKEKCSFFDSNYVPNLWKLKKIEEQSQ